MSLDPRGSSTVSTEVAEGGTPRAGHGRVVMLSRSWWRPHSEPAVVSRGLAGGLSRHWAVEVVTPGRPDPPKPDGLFHVWQVGGTGGPTEWPAWPAPEAASWPGKALVLDGPLAAIVIEARDDGAKRLVEAHAPGYPVVVVDADDANAAPGDRILPLDQVGLFMPVNAHATTRAHTNLTITGDYLVVLTDRPAETDENGQVLLEERPIPSGTPGMVGAVPTAQAAWLIARFPRKYFIVVEDGSASVWHRRAPIGSLKVDTRTDLWRLMAHAMVTVDLRPGPLVARECAESLLFGTPIVVPGGSVAAKLAATGGGLWFRNPAELISCVAALANHAIGPELGRQGQEVARSRYGDPELFVSRLAERLRELIAR